MDVPAPPPPPPVAARAETARTGPIAARLPAADDADLALLYTAEEQGSLDTCGCADRPRGAIARAVGYRRALGDARPGPSLLVDVGGWLDDAAYPDGALQEHVLARDAFAVEAFETSYDALGVGWRDLPYLAAAGWPASAVSANVRGPRDVPAVRRFDADGVAVVITSVTGPGQDWKRPAGWTVSDPVDAVRGLGLAPDDLVVVLAFDTDDATRALVALPNVDVVIEADAFAERFEPLGDADTVWVRAHTRGMRLGELRLSVDEGRVRTALDRHVDLDEAVPHDRRLWRLRAAQRRALGARSD